MPSQSRRRRGRQTELSLAEWFRNQGWPNAEAVASSLPGRDLVGMPGLAPEVKARDGLSIPAALRQATKNAGADLPFVVYRPNGSGEQSIPDWIAFLRLGDFARILIENGYGDEPPHYPVLEDRDPLPPMCAKCQQMWPCLTEVNRLANA